MTTKSAPVCLVCNKKSTTVFLKVKKFAYYRCRNCTGIFVDPIKPQDFYLSTETYLTNAKEYTKRLDPLGHRWLIEQFERMYEDHLDTKEKGLFFEIGAGVGYLTLFALARGWQARGIETSKQAVKFAQDYFKVDVSLSTIESYESETSFDAIVMVEVLEHFLDPIEAIGSIRKLSGRHTVLFGTTPNTDSDHWKKSNQNIYVPDDHIFLFNEKSIRLFAHKAGIKDLKVETFGSGDKNDSNLMYSGIIIS